MAEGSLSMETMGRGFAWRDTGTPARLLGAGNFGHTLTKRRGQKMDHLQEIAFAKGLMSEKSPARHPRDLSHERLWRLSHGLGRPMTRACPTCSPHADRRGRPDGDPSPEWGRTDNMGDTRSAVR